MGVSGSHRQSLVKHHSQSLKNQTQQQHWENTQLQAAAATPDPAESRVALWLLLTVHSDDCEPVLGCTHPESR